MSLRYYLILMSIGALICWLAWFFVLGSIDPTQAGFFGFLFFYASLFLALTGTFSVIGFLIKKIVLKNDQVIFHHVRSTFRQGDADGTAYYRRTYPTANQATGLVECHLASVIVHVY
jgi:hypothetical protein